jgi:hypothetical protein
MRDPAGQRHDQTAMKKALLLPAELVRELIQLIRKSFFEKVSEKQFFQERPMLERAICHPARYLKDRGATKLSAARYRSIILTVINTIKQHGNRASIDRFSVYFLHCVQQHMVYHGDEYYQEAKEMRSAGAVASQVLKKMLAGGSADRTVEVLAETHRVLARRGRIQKKKSSSAQPDLFNT